MWFCDNCGQPNEDSEAVCAFCAEGERPASSGGAPAPQEEAAWVVVCGRCGFENVCPTEKNTLEVCAKCGSDSVQNVRKATRRFRRPVPPAKPACHRLELREITARAGPAERGECPVFLQTGAYPEFTGVTAAVCLSEQSREQVIGRGTFPGALQTAFHYLSEAHCQISYAPEEEQWYITDLGSTNGTRLDGQKVLRGMRRKLREKSTVQLADKLFVVFLEESGAAGHAD